MKDIQIFNNPEFGEIRTTIVDGEPYFVGKDVAEVLAYKETAKAIREHVDDDDKGVSVLDTPGGKQKMVVINESGLYGLVFGSKLPTVKKFKHWVTSEVLPTIRKTGGYHVQSPEEQMAQGLLAAQKLLAEKDKRIEEMRPKEIFADAVSVSKTKLFRVKETVVTHSDGHTTVSKTTKVTGKGQVYFVNKFLNGSKAVLE